MQKATPTRLIPGRFNPYRRLIRVRKVRDNGFVEFDFAIGDAELCVELILPRAAFKAFERMPNTERMSEDDAAYAFRRHQSYLYGQPDGEPRSTHNNKQET